MSAGERVIYQGWKVTVSTARLTVGSETYPMSAISSFRKEKGVNPKRIYLTMAFLALPFVSIALGAFTNNSIVGFGSLFAGLAAVMGALACMPVAYKVVLGSAGGERVALDGMTGGDNRIKELESILDTGRTSSGVTPGGDPK